MIPLTLEKTQPFLHTSSCFRRYVEGFYTWLHDLDAVQGDGIELHSRREISFREDSCVRRVDEPLAISLDEQPALAEHTPALPLLQPHPSNSITARKYKGAKGLSL